MTTSVTLSVDGKEREVRVFGDTVGDVLEAEGIELADARPRRSPTSTRRSPTAPASPCASAARSS